MLFKKEKYIIALEIEEAYLKFAVGFYKNGASSLIRLEGKKFSFENLRESVRILKNLLGEYKRLSPYIILNIPRRHLTVRDMKVPSSEEAEIRNILDLQVTNQIPYSKEEIVSDFKVIKVLPEGFSEVFFAIAHKDVIKKRMEFLANLGINVDIVSLSTDSIWAWFLMQGIEAGDKPFAVLDIDRTHAEIIIANKDTFEFSRSFSYKEDDHGKFLEEVRLSISTYSEEKDLQVENIFLCGASSLIDDIEDDIKTELAITCQKLDSFEKITLNSNLKKNIENLKEISFNALLGCLFNPTALILNLLPKDIILGRRISALRKSLTILIFLLIALLQVISVAIYFKIKEKKDIFNQIESRLKMLEPDVSRLNKISKNISVIKNQMDLRGSSIDVIREIYSVIPGDVFLTSLEYEEAKHVILKGNSPTLSGILNFVNRLEKSGYFEGVKLKYATKRKMAERESTDFEINAPLSLIRAE